MDIRHRVPASEAWRTMAFTADEVDELERRLAKHDEQTPSVLMREVRRQERLVAVRRQPVEPTTMILTPRPCARPDRRPSGRRVAAQRARRTATRSASRGDPEPDLDPPGGLPQPQAEVELLRREWSSLSGVQRVQRVAMLELHTGVEWTTVGDIFTRRGAIIEWREEAA